MQGRLWREGRRGGLGRTLGNGMGAVEEGCREVNILIKGAILGFARDLILEGFPDPRRGPQIVPWAAEERVPELAFPLATLMNILHISIKPSSGNG